MHTIERLSRLEQALQDAPDVIFVDLTQPEDLFFERFAQWRSAAPDAAFILCTRDHDKEEHSTLELIQRGAADRLKIPAQSVGLLHAMDALEDKTLSKIRRLSRAPSARPRTSARATMATPHLSTKEDFDRAFHRTITRLEATRSKLARTLTRGDVHAPGARPPAPEDRAPAPLAPATAGSFGLLTIGVSTGGPQALHELFTQLSAPLPVPTLIVQHMPPNFTKILAQRLDSLTQNTVVEAEHGMVLEPAHVLVAPGNFHMTIAREQGRVVVELSSGEKVNGCRPAVDGLWESIPGALLGGCLAVIMTGMGKDGLDGARALQEIGATVIAQDEATSVVWGMPGAIAQAGLAHAVFGLPELGQEIMKRLARSGGPARRPTAHTKESDHEIPHRR
ncbi:MAG: chemotaxis protein CheB [Myxococcota bacterium]